MAHDGAHDRMTLASTGGRLHAGKNSPRVVGRDIICCSTHYWHERWFRKQEFMSRFASANRVLFVEPSFSMVRRPEPHLKEFATNRFLLTRAEDARDGVQLLKPPRALPKWTYPKVEEVNFRWFGKRVSAAAESLGFRRTLLWVYTTPFFHALSDIDHEHLVFDLIDDLPAYDGVRSAHVEADVLGLAQESSLLVATTPTLLDRYGGAARRTAAVANGYDARLFSFADAGPRTSSAPLVLGFVGTLFSFIDFELLEAVADAHSDKVVLLIGPVEESARGAAERLFMKANVRHLGPRPREEIPRHVAGFDVCLNPFRTGRVADSVSPLKVYEYLAMGRPVVSTPMKALQAEDVASHITFGANHIGFCDAISDALEWDTSAAASARAAAAAPHSWDRLFEQLDEACGDALSA